jgi:hypothetical protein
MVGSRDGVETHAGVADATLVTGVVAALATLVTGAVELLGVFAATYPLSTIPAAASICSRVDNGAPLANHE